MSLRFLQILLNYSKAAQIVVMAKLNSCCKTILNTNCLLEQTTRRSPRLPATAVHCRNLVNEIFV